MCGGSKAADGVGETVPVLEQPAAERLTLLPARSREPCNSVAIVISEWLGEQISALVRGQRGDEAAGCVTVVRSGPVGRGEDMQGTSS